MSTAKILLDKWMKTRSLASLKEASKILGKSATALTNWRTGYAKPDDQSIARMCEECGEDGALWVAKLHAEFEHDQRVKKVWLRLAQIAAAVALTVGIAPTHAAPVSSAHNPGGVYIMSNIWKAARKAGMRFADLMARLMERGHYAQKPDTLALAV